MRHLDRTIDTLKGMAPTTPPTETCPLIDATIMNINDAVHRIGELRLQAMNTLEPMPNDVLAEEIAKALKQLEPLEQTLEKIRHHNAHLRNLSLYWYRTAKQLHEEGGGKK